MNHQNTFDPKYAALGVVVILLSITVLVILPNLLKKQLAKLGKQ
jgi:competence protein ComGC